MLLIVGGTSEGFEICDALAKLSVATVHSRSGVSEGRKTTRRIGALVRSLRASRIDLRQPFLYYRLGGFTHNRLSSSAGLLMYIRRHRISMIADLSHPFAVNISASVARAAKEAGVPLLRLSRRYWLPSRQPKVEGEPSWKKVLWVDNAAEAAKVAAAVVSESNSSGLSDGRIAITSGRSTLSPFLKLNDTKLWIRVLSPKLSTDVSPIANAQTRGIDGVTHCDNMKLSEPQRAKYDIVWRFAQGPFDYQSEMASFAANGCTILVSKNSGGLEAKFAAAATLGMTMVIIRRARPNFIGGVAASKEVQSSAQLMANLRRSLLKPPYSHVIAGVSRRRKK